MNAHTSRGQPKSRRDVARFALALGATVLLPPGARAQTAASIMTRPIPSTGEALAMVGLGTASLYNRDNEGARRSAQEVLQALVGGGATLVDTASTYGDAEIVFGEVVAASGLRNKLFIATKLEAPDAAELKRSLARLKVAKLDLLQLHNVRDPRQSLAQFRRWKDEGVCRYVGITSTFHGDYAAMEAVLRREKPDFLQIDYSVDNREAEKRLLPLAAEVKTAVLTALPFGRNRLFRAVRGKTLPEWATDFDVTTWAQFFLKYLLGNPAVTAVIPGTANGAHMADNLGAARGRLPDAAQRRRMAEFIETL
jgi:aryl-alcohol dehydrogenase-like predicted oxidoreductase